MTASLMRRLFSSCTRVRFSAARFHFGQQEIYLTVPRLLGLKQYQRSIADVRPRQAQISRTWFTSSSGCAHPDMGSRDLQPPDERTLKLGKTIRVLHERLPTLLASPLPQDILSPHITLHLFPSSHPHLPTVSGKIAYTAALWTAPVAWGRVPVVGNVKLEVLSERMVKNGCANSAAEVRNERLIVRWKTCDKTKKTNGDASMAMDSSKSIVGASSRSEHEFSGLFIFEFDEEGRIHNHTIEHAEEGGNWDKTAKVISVTDWLLGRAWGKRDEEVTPSLAFVNAQRKRVPVRPEIDFRSHKHIKQ